MAHLIDKSALVAEIERLRKELQDKVETSDFIAGEVFIMNYFLSFLDTLEVKEVDMGKSIDVDSMVTEYLKQYEEAGQTPFAMNIIGSAYMKGLEDMFRLKAQKGEEV